MSQQDLEKTETEPDREPETLDMGLDLVLEPDQAEEISRINSHASQLHRVLSRKASSTANPKDPWGYEVDPKTGFRIVHFVDGDKGNPQNFPRWRKWMITVVLGFVCFAVALGSAIVTGDLERPAEHFHVSMETITLTVTMFVIGFGVGPLLFAPLSEEVGRSVVYITTFGLGVVFVVPCAVAQNIGTLLVCRLIDGIAFSAPITIIGGSLADMFESHERGMAMSVFSAAPFIGPIVGPLVGGFISDYAPTWRWIYWVLLFFSAFMYILLVLLVPETHHATLLTKRAKKLIKLTGDDTYRTAKQLLEKQSWGNILKTSCLRPFQLLTEVIVFLITLYMSVVYGLLYMFFFAYPVVYGEGKGFHNHEIGLMFLPILVGVIGGAFCVVLANSDYVRRAKKWEDKGQLPPPELRLIPMMVGAWFVPAGLFAFAWTSFPHVHWAGPCVSGFGVGFGFILLYNSANNYLVDSYKHYAASALAAKTFVRSIWGASVVLFTVQMYHRLGYEWAGSLIAFISLACAAIPYMFFFFGPAIRKRSKYAYSGQE